MYTPPVGNAVPLSFFTDPIYVPPVGNLVAIDFANIPGSSGAGSNKGTYSFISLC